MIIETCPKCGHDLKDEVLTSIPPIYVKYCPNCGWTHESRENVVRVKFNENNNTPLACKWCSNHPSNGGDGNCNCILGIQDIK